MAIIKPAHSGRLLKDAVVLDMSDLAREAERIRTAARREAQQILDNAQQEAQRLISGAAERGFAEGLAKGQMEGLRSGTEQGRERAFADTQKQLAELSEQWTRALQQWEQDRALLFQDAREDVITFAIAVAEKVVRRVLAVDPSVIVDQLSEALRLISQPTRLNIEINPDDRAIIEEALPGIIETLTACQHVQLHVSPDMVRGGCIVRSQNGHVDASIETQLSRIAELLVQHGSITRASS